MKIFVSVIIAGVIIGGAILVTRGNSSTPLSGNGVTVVDGIQIITLHAKGGYSPRVSIARAGIPTILRISTSGTFDCSSSVRIPSLNISKILPNTGSTDIDLGTPPAGSLQGTCSMGMYPFEIQFNE